MTNQLQVAKIGKTVGLRGELKLHILTDFPEIFTQKKEFESSFGTLKIEKLNLASGIVKFVGYDDIDAAKKLTNQTLFSTVEETRALCRLGEDEYFEFDIIGCQVVEDNQTLGIVDDIIDIVGTSYLSIKGEKNFLLPYLNRYIQSVDVTLKIIIAIDAKELMDAS